MAGLLFRGSRALVAFGLILLAGKAVEAVESGAAAEVSAADEERLRKSNQGEVVRMTLLNGRAQLPKVGVKIENAPGPQFLFSDRPEYFLTGNGIALQEEVEAGTVRLYLYHVPEPAGEKKVISAVIENLGKQPMSLRILRSAFPSPGTDYQRIAKEALERFLSCEPEKKAKTILPGEIAPLDANMDATVATKDQLVHGFYEFEIDQPARMSVLQRNPDQSSGEAVKTLPKLPQVLPGKKNGNGAGRGIFSVCNFAVTNEMAIDTMNGAMQLIVADGKQEGWIRGHDGIEKTDSRDVGNYGAMYRIRLTRASSDGRGLALLLCNLNARSQWCGRLAAAVHVSEGVFPAGVVRLPSDRPVFGEAEEGALIQKFPPLRKGETGTIELVYSPPGAACIPTPLVFVPYRP